MFLLHCPSLLADGSVYFPLESNCLADGFQWYLTAMIHTYQSFVVCRFENIPQCTPLQSKTMPRLRMLVLESRICNCQGLHAIHKFGCAIGHNGVTALIAPALQLHALSSQE